MAEYILRTDAESIMAMLVMEVSERPKDFTCGEAVRAIRSIPAADVVPVRHGRYIIDDMGDSSCSECGEKWLDVTKNYCPNCGAKLDGE